jgi:uncharacterized protein (TIGR03067 family)
MKRFLPLAFFAVLLIAADTPEEEQKLFQGTWVPRKLAKDGQALPQKNYKGKPFPKELLDNLKITFSENKITLKVGDDIKSGTFVLDPTKKPREITINHPDGTKPSSGIYGFDDNGWLWLTFGKPGETRPKKFIQEGCQTLVLEKQKQQ